MAGRAGTEIRCVLAALREIIKGVIIKAKEQYLRKNQKTWGMDRGYIFSAELLQMMLSEERQKFVSALGRGASWKELNRIRKHIAQINHQLDSMNNTNRGQGRYEDNGRG